MRAVLGRRAVAEHPDEGAEDAAVRGPVEALEIPERTVASRLIAAKARLKALLDSGPAPAPQVDLSTLSEDSVPSD